jgi:hypothetical protein
MARIAEWSNAHVVWRDIWKENDRLKELGMNWRILRRLPGNLPYF